MAEGEEIRWELPENHRRRKELERLYITLFCVFCQTVTSLWLEMARIILGHRSAAITEVYAEQDKEKAQEAIVKVG